MGLPPEARARLCVQYKAAFAYVAPTDATVVVYDLMQALKAIPDDIMSLDALLTYLVNRIKSILCSPGTAVRTVIVLVDREPPPVKRMVEHVKRYSDVERLAVKEEGGACPYLPLVLTGMLPRPWLAFSGDYRNLQRELYPRLLNEFMDCKRLVLAPGQSIVLHGFPGRVEMMRTHAQHPYTINTDLKARVPQVYRWDERRDLPITLEDERADPNLYNRVFIIENVTPSPNWPQGFLSKREWVEARNSIREADGAMFFYDRFYPTENIMFWCNDGDVFSYALLYAYERTTMQNTFRNKHYVCLPYKRKSSPDAFPAGDKPRYEYVDVNHFYALVMEDPCMVRAGVQNNAITLVFMLIMAGSDFFSGGMKGIGMDSVVWPVFLEKMKEFSHLVQLSKGLAPSMCTTRQIVLDEDLFRLFVHYCYVQKHGKQLEKKTKGAAITYKALVEHCASSKLAQKDPGYELPDRNTVRLWARQVLWNLMYFKNAPFGREHEPDCFRQYMGLPYYPYVRNAETGVAEMSTAVCAHQLPVDEVYMQHLMRRRRKA